VGKLEVCWEEILAMVAGRNGETGSGVNALLLWMGVCFFI